MPSLTIDNVSVRVPGGTILEIPGRITLAAGSNVAVLGENGAGKTTLLNCVLGQQQYSGTITPKLNLNDAAVVLQENNYPEFIRTDELIQLVIKASKKSPAYQNLLKDFNLQALEKKFVAKLSGGESQRLTLALALSTPKSFCFFDEISSGLDYRHRQELSYAIRQKTKDALVLNISHYFEEIQDWATHVLLLHYGQLRYFGTLDGFYSAYLHHAAAELPVPAEKIMAGAILKDYEYSNNMFFLFSDKESKKLMETLKAKDIPCKINSQSLASTYAYALSQKASSEQKGHPDGPVFTDTLY